ncbi:MAG: HAD family hydrolase [Deltaproteobacteria bacterium]|nr:HAD family hydrolase [Deltaproteobacteria bacterium]
MARRLRAVVFDFDGVIVESGDIKTEAFLELFADHPQHLPAIKRHHLDNLGISRFIKFAWIYEHLLGLPFDIGEKVRLGDRFSAIVFQKVCETPFVPGALESLELLSRAGVHLVVSSGTPQDELDRIVDARGLRRFFAEVHGSPTEKAAAVAHVLQRWALHRDEVLFVGDGTTDHQAAAQSGVRFLARRTPDLAAHWATVGCECVDDLRGLERRVVS